MQCILAYLYVLAWLLYRAQGGVEAERAERTRQKEEAAAKDRRNFEWLQQLRREGFRKVSPLSHQLKGVQAPQQVGHTV